MKLLVLNGYGASINVDGSKLIIKDGHSNTTEPSKQYTYRPRRIDLEHIIFYSRNGSISIDGIRWLIKHNIQISVLNWDGKLLTTMLPQESGQTKARIAQYKAFEDQDKRVEIARKLLDAKFARTKEMLEYLKKGNAHTQTDFTKELNHFKQAQSIQELMMIEGRIASFYWQQLTKTVPKEYEFETREYQKRPWGAGDKTNCLLNYGYAVLEAECLRAINSAGLDPHIGFLHEMNEGKNSLAYDLQEPFRFLIDQTVLNLIQSDTLVKKDFIRTDNFNLRLTSQGTRKLTKEIDKTFNTKTTYTGQNWSWRYIILDKATQLSHYLQKKKVNLDFLTDKTEMLRSDTNEIRQKIRDISYEKWEEKGYSKGTLHYLKTNAKSLKNFKIYGKALEKIQQIEV